MFYYPQFIDLRMNREIKSRSSSKPGAFRWGTQGMLPFYSGCNLQRHHENSLILPSTIPRIKHDGYYLFYIYRSLNIFMGGKGEKITNSRNVVPVGQYRNVPESSCAHTLERTLAPRAELSGSAEQGSTKLSSSILRISWRPHQIPD